MQRINARGSPTRNGLITNKAGRVAGCLARKFNDGYCVVAEETANARFELRRVLDAPREGGAFPLAAYVGNAEGHCIVAGVFFQQALKGYDIVDDGLVFVGVGDADNKGEVRHGGWGLVLGGRC